MMKPRFTCRGSVGETMKLLSAIAVLLIIVGVCLEPYPSDASGKYDGSVPFLCVPSAVAECVANGECRPGTAEVRIFQTSSRSISRPKPSALETKTGCHPSSGSTAVTAKSSSTVRKPNAPGFLMIQEKKKKKKI